MNQRSIQIDPVLLWVACLFILFVALYSAFVPPFEGPDSGAHFRYAAFLQENPAIPPLDLVTTAVSHELVQQPPLYYALVALFTSGMPVADAVAMDVGNPYYRLGLSKRATVSVAVKNSAATLPLWIARGIAGLGGLLTVVFSYLLVRKLIPQQWPIALSVAAIVGFNPQFLFTSATITNDTWAAFTAVLALWMALHSLEARESRWAWVWVGLCVGLAALAKYGNLTTAVPLVLLLWAYACAAGWRRGLQAALAIGIGATLVAGFWYGRNLLQWGSLVPLGQMLTVLPGLAREIPASAAEIRQQLLWLLRSYWGVFGYGVLAQHWYYPLVKNLVFSGLIGLFIFLLRSFPWRIGERRDQTENRVILFAALLSILWFGSVFNGLLNWMRLVRFTDQGRLLFPAAPAIALLLALGWHAFFPERWQRWVAYFVLVGFVGLAFSQLFTLYDAYRLPTPLPEPVAYDREILAHFEGGMTLLGIDLPDGAAIGPDGEMSLTLYWRSEQEISEFYTLFLHLTDVDGKMLYQFDGVPFRGRHPTRQWVSGEVFADSYKIRLNEPAPDGLALLSLGFYNYQEPTHRLAILDETGAAVDSRVVLTPVRVHRRSEVAQELQTDPVALWIGGIALADFAIDTDSDGQPVALSATWQANQVVHKDYTVFVQVLDAKNNVTAQVDQRPAAGEYPTVTWRPGDQIHDFYRFAKPPADWARVIIGLYDQTGQRLVLDSATAPNDYFELLTR